MTRAKLILLSVSVLVAGVVIASSAAIYSRLLAHKTNYTYISEALFDTNVAAKHVTWKSSDAALTRPFTPIDESIIGRAVSEAWMAFYSAQDLGKVEFFGDYYQNTALDRAKIAATSAFDQATYYVNIDTDAQPIFYHVDGSVFQMRSTSLAIRFVENSGDSLAHFPSFDTNITTLIKEPAGWRIVDFKREATRPVVKRDTIVIDMPKLAGINYYPANTPWRQFWSEFDRDIVSADFKKVRELGGNSVRIFLPVDEFGDPNPVENLAHLQDLLNIATANDLSVIPTLFDLRHGYGLAVWARDVQYLRNVLPVLQSYDAVLFVDLKNEPDLDFEIHGRLRVEAWLRSMLLHMHTNAPQLAVTIGWSKAEFGAIMADDLDVISYHDYQYLSGTHGRVQQLKNRFDGKPIVVTEIGESSWRFSSLIFDNTEKQADRLADRLSGLNGTDGVFVWTLHDFPDPDTAAVGVRPWVKKKQSEFGLIDSSGVEKPAARVVRRYFLDFIEDR